MTRARSWLAALALAVGSLGGAQAVVAPVLTLNQQASRAEVIVRGVLGAPQTGEDGQTSWRVYPLTITETVVGDVSDLPQQGSQTVLYVWADARDLPEWRTGQDAFFLLYTGRMDSPLVGYNQGYYPVVGGRVTLPESAPIGTSGAAASAAGFLPVAQPPVAELTTPPADLDAATGAERPAPALPGDPEIAPPPADDAPDAPPVPPAEGGPTLPPGLPSTAPQDTLPASNTPPAASPAQAVTPASPQDRQVSVDEFRALLLAARGGTP
ncbi:hypothetical protein [Deinococcus radiophilus]|uniref:hypothetical protein n=1 Tax=Deinococcus radiophilus TaxID=32062 RepID=UPI001B87AE2E|nr:hypothetical protein [Deinococcus radiophilus]UFA49386.1 hypothetical protein LMT64_05565 [Deinococcus radiophilus]